MNTHTVIVGRSTTEVRETLLIEAHDAITSSLNATCNGRCLYVGRQREQHIALKQKIERCILGDSTYEQEFGVLTPWHHLAALR